MIGWRDIQRLGLLVFTLFALEIFLRCSQREILLKSVPKVISEDICLKSINSTLYNQFNCSNMITWHYGGQGKLIFQSLSKFSMYNRKSWRGDIFLDFLFFYGNQFILVEFIMIIIPKSLSRILYDLCQKIVSKSSKLKKLRLFSIFVPNRDILNSGHTSNMLYKS